MPWYFVILAVVAFYASVKIWRSKENGGKPVKRDVKYDSLIVSLCNQEGLPANLRSLIKATVKRESDFNPKAYNKNDPSYGLCGITPFIGNAFTGKGSSVDLWNPKINLLSCVRFYRDLLTKWKLDEAIQCYNLGEPKFSKGYRVPDYLSYVKKWSKIYVLINYI